MTGVSFPVAFSAADESDRGFILQMWTRSLYRAQRQDLPLGSWKRAYRSVQLELLNRCNVLVAHDPSDRDGRYGFVVADGPKLMYVFVAKSRRDGGLGAALLRTLKLSTYNARAPRKHEEWARKMGLHA